MSLAEVIAAAITAGLAVVPVAAYLIDAAGFGVVPVASIVAGLASGAAMAWRLSKRVTPNPGDTVAIAGIAIFLIAMFLRMSWPSFVPPGRGPDLTHHLLLVDYIEQNRHLVHDRALDGVMGEMAHYTPGSHLLAVIGGAAVGADGLRAFFPLAVLCAALTGCFVFLIARRIGIARPYAIAAVAMLFLPAPYFFGAFTYEGFLSQTVSTLFAVAAWWAIAAWDDRPSRDVSVLIAIFLAAAFLSWPIWIGPPLLVFSALLVANYSGPRDLTTSRPSDLAIVFLPLLGIFLLHSWDRWGWMVIVRTSGAVLRPSLENVGFQLPLLALVGIAAAAHDRRARVTIVLLAVIALQAITLLGVAKSQGADTPYMAFKMMYLAIYPLAILATYAVARFSRFGRAHESLGWLLAAVLLVAVVRPALAAPREVPIVDLDLQAAGQWLRANNGAACADYLVGDAETAYWLHLAVLGNPRSGERMIELDRYEPRRAMAPWITAEGRRYAIAALDLLPAEVSSRTQILERFGRAAVIARPDATMKGCD